MIGVPKSVCPLKNIIELSFSTQSQFPFVIMEVFNFTLPTMLIKTGFFKWKLESSTEVFSMEKE